MKQDKPFFQNELQFLGQCPVCKHNFKQEKARVVERKENLTLLHAHCSYCNSSVMILVMGASYGLVATVGMLTDLTQEDISRFQNQEKLTVDDFLQFYQYLEK